MRTACFLLVSLALFLVGPVQTADAGPPPITPKSSTGHGAFENAATLLIDGSMPAEESDYNGPACVFWEDADTYFTIDLGEVYRIEGLTLQVDNNDDYEVAASTDGKAFSPVLRVSGDWGEATYGMQTVSTLKGSAGFMPQLTLSPVSARYLKVGAAGGDAAYAVSEVQVWGARELPPATPQPPAPGASSGEGSSGGLAGMQRIFVSMDVDRDGKVTLDEYAAVWKDKLDVRGNFAFFDKDRSGTIELSEYLLQADTQGQQQSGPAAPGSVPGSTPPPRSAAPQVPDSAALSPPSTPGVAADPATQSPTVPSSSGAAPAPQALGVSVSVLPPSPGRSAPPAPATQGGDPAVSIKLDPVKVQGAINALPEWSEMEKAAKAGDATKIDQSVKKHGFSDWFDLNMYVSQVCNLGGMILQTSDAKKFVSDNYGAEAAAVVAKPQNLEQIRIYSPQQ